MKELVEVQLHHVTSHTWDCLQDDLKTITILYKEYYLIILITTTKKNYYLIKKIIRSYCNTILLLITYCIIKK